MSTPPRSERGPKDDQAWTGARVPTATWLSYKPVHGDAIPQQTRVWAAYDADARYFALRCDDPDPAGIKSSITRRSKTATSTLLSRACV